MPIISLKLKYNNERLIKIILRFMSKFPAIREIGKIENKKY